MSHLTQDIKQCVLKFLFRQLNDIINFNIFLESASRAMADREKKEGKMNIEKFEHL